MRSASERAEWRNIWIAVKRSIVVSDDYRVGWRTGPSLRLSEGVEASQRRVEMIRMNDSTDQLECS